AWSRARATTRRARCGSISRTIRAICWCSSVSTSSGSQGKFPEMLALADTLTRYHPGSSFMLGLHAFVLEQAGRCDEAVRMALVANQKNPRDAWAIHALAHGLYEMAAFDTGITRLPPAIEPCTHLGWFKNH